MVMSLRDYETTARHLPRLATGCRGGFTPPAFCSRRHAAESVLRLAVLPTPFPGRFCTKFSKYMIFLIGTPKRLETRVSHRKHTTAPLSNRDKFALHPSYLLPPPPHFHSQMNQATVAGR